MRTFQNTRPHLLVEDATEIPAATPHDRGRSGTAHSVHWSANVVEEMTARNDDTASLAMGALLARLRELSPEQVEAIARHQRESGLRFGEAAVALGHASADDVQWALGQQFHYPTATADQRHANPELVALNAPHGVQAESLRALRSQVLMRVFNGAGVTRQALAVVSPNSGDGKTFLAANLAASLAQLGGRTLVLDADMRQPRLHQVFGVGNESGLSGVLSGRAESRVIRQVEGVPNLFVLPVGPTPPNPLELVERTAFGALMRELLGKFEHVVVDTPAAVHGSDYAVIASRCGAALALARSQRTGVAALRELTASLADAPIRMAGVVINEF